VTSRYVPREVWNDFLRSSKRPRNSVEFIQASENGENATVVLAGQPDIIAFMDWVLVNGIQQGFFTQDNQITAEVDQSFANPNLSDRAKRENLKPFRLVVGEYKYGVVELTTDPPGAEVYMNGMHYGSTASTLHIPRVKPGSVELLIILEGYKPRTLNARVKEGQSLSLTATLQPSQGVVFGKTWHNGIDMRFEPVEADLMASAYETRVSDYEAFTQGASHEHPSKPEFEQGKDHPVVYVSRDDAKAFCKWLTEKEREEELIGQTHQYRLPTDLEWNMIADLKREDGDGPSQRDANKSMLYAWGADWPPPDAYGNYADSTAADHEGPTSSRIIPGYADGFPRTSPAGEFHANKFGIYDLSGNVHEWIEDDIFVDTENSLGVLRGGGWNTYRQEDLVLGWRNPVQVTARTGYYGFRIVLAKTDPSKDFTTNNE
jgi:hypothetical protein